MNSEVEQDSYFDICALCGLEQTFARCSRAVRESYRCKSCQASLREREQAKAIILTYADVPCLTFKKLVPTPKFRELKIYEPGTIGPFRKFLKCSPNYVQSHFSPDVVDNSIRFQDLQRLDFADQSFDLIITSDIMEHVRKPEVAFREIYRVLKPGSFHIFTVPLKTSSALKTVSRMDVSGEEDIPILPPHFHGATNGRKSLVYTDFGQDLATSLEELNFLVKFLSPKTSSDTVNKIITIISRKPS